MLLLLGVVFTVLLVGTSHLFRRQTVELNAILGTFVYIGYVSCWLVHGGEAVVVYMGSLLILTSLNILITS